MISPLILNSFDLLTLLWGKLPYPRYYVYFDTESRTFRHECSRWRRGIFVGFHGLLHLFFNVTCLYLFLYGLWLPSTCTFVNLYAAAALCSMFGFSLLYEEIFFRQGDKIALGANELLRLHKRIYFKPEQSSSVDRAQPSRKGTRLLLLELASNLMHRSPGETDRLIGMIACMTAYFLTVNPYLAVLGYAYIYKFHGFKADPIYVTYVSVYGLDNLPPVIAELVVFIYYLVFVVEINRFIMFGLLIFVLVVTYTVRM